MSDVRRAVATHAEIEGCEAERGNRMFRAARTECMDAEFRAVCFAPKQADVLQARSPGASRLIFLMTSSLFGH